MQELVIAELGQVEKEFSIERSREYLTGHSMGAAGTYRIAYRWPDRFAPLVTVSGMIQPITLGAGRADVDRSTNPFTADPDVFSKLAGRIKHLPIWVFHGDIDDVVPVDQSRQLTSALKSFGADIHYSEFHGVGHNDAAAKAYADLEMLRWLVNTHRSAGNQTQKDKGTVISFRSSRRCWRRSIPERQGIFRWETGCPKCGNDPFAAA